MVSQDSNQFATLNVIHEDISLPGEERPEGDMLVSQATSDRRYVLRAELCFVGRNEHECDIRIDRKRLDVSRKHASIRRQGPRYILEDHSRYGTFVNGQRIDGPWELTTGDVIGLANSREMLLFEDPKQVGTLDAEPLTKRELEILRRVAVGQSNKEIAHDLDVQLDTVKSHLKAIYAKLGVGNRTEAGNIARRRGLLTTSAE